MKLLVSFTIVWVAVAGAGTPLMLNEDNSHFYFVWPPELMTRDGLNAWVDQYAGTSVTHLMLNPNAMRASYASAVRDTIWESGAQTAPPEGSPGAHWISNARLLFARGLDPYAVWIARARETGIAPWVSVRMNDIHDVDDSTNYMHSAFWVNHPEFRRVPANPQSWQDRAFDFSHPEVREHVMSLIREMLARYDVDGIELDWMRFPYHFAPGTEDEGRTILTGFMREVRNHATVWEARRGHAIKVGARVPTTPENAEGLGMDAVTWANEGLIDVLVPTPFWASCDSDVPMEDWRARLGDSKGSVTLAGGIEFLVGAYPGAPQAAAGYDGMRGFAAMMLYRGADAVYLFNYMDAGPESGPNEAYHAMLKRPFDLASIARQPRRHILTYRDTVAPGASSNAQLPATLDTVREFTLHIGPAPEVGTATVRVGLAAPGEATGEGAVREVRVNGAGCALAPTAALADVPGADWAVDGAFDRTSLRDGFNAVAVSGDDAGVSIVWIELRLGCD